MSADVIKGLEIARRKATELRAITSLFTRDDKGQRRMATRIIAELDTEIEVWRDKLCSQPEVERGTSAADIPLDDDDRGNT